MTSHIGKCLYEWTAESQGTTPQSVYLGAGIPKYNSTIYDNTGNTLSYTISNIAKGNTYISLSINTGSADYTFRRQNVGSSIPILSATNVVPSSVSQTINAANGIDAFSSVTVSPVNSSVDINLTPSNIKSGVTILGVTGTYVPVAVNWSDWTYTTNNNIKILSNYVGQNTTVVIPDLNTRIKKANYTEYTDEVGIEPHSSIFLNRSNLTSIDFNNVPFEDNNAAVCCGSVYSNSALQQISNLNCDIVSLGYSFFGCTNLNSSITLPPNVTNLVLTFASCSKLNQPINIPNGVTNIAGIFQACSKLNQPLVIPNSVIDINGAFYYCTNLNSDITIGSNVTHMSGAFYYATAMRSNITILSENVSDCTQCFNSTSVTKNVYLPFTYSNGVNTVTYNTFKTAYGSGQNGVTLVDLNA